MATLADFERATGYNVVPRSEWSADRGPSSPLTPIPIPTPRLWIHHAAVEGADNAAELRAHRDYHMDVRGWKFLAYSLAIPDPNPSRVVFEGRGIGIQGGHTANENSESHGILVMGNFMVDRPSESAVTTLVDLARYGRDAGWWVPTCGGHRDAPGATTSCPGNFLYARLPEIRARIAQPPEEEDMPLTAAEIKAIAKAVWAYEFAGVDKPEAPARSHLRWANYNAGKAVDLLEAEVPPAPAPPS